MSVLKRPPRSRSCQSLQHNTISHNIQLIQSQVLKDLPIQHKEQEECKYCLLKQKFAKHGEKVLCLAHSVLVNKKQNQNTLPMTPPLKPKKQPYGNYNFSLEPTKQIIDVEKLTKIAQQLYQCLFQFNNVINWTQYPVLLNTLKKCFDFLPLNSKFSRSELLSKSSFIFEQSQSSIQFQLSSIEQPSRKIYKDDSFKNMLSYLTHESKQNNYIRSQTMASFIHEIQYRFKCKQETINKYKQQVQQLTKKYNEKISTDHTLKQFQQDLNFADKFSELQDLSKQLSYVCFINKHKFDTQYKNEDVMNYLLIQAHGLENLIERP